MTRKKKNAAIHYEGHRNDGFETKPYKFVGFPKQALPRQFHCFRNAHCFDETRIILLS